MQFIETSVFSRSLRELGLEEEALRDLQNQLIGNPHLGPIDHGTGGLREKTEVSMNCNDPAVSKRYISYIVVCD